MYSNVILIYIYTVSLFFSFSFSFLEKEKGEGKAGHSALHMYVQMCWNGYFIMAFE